MAYFLVKMTKTQTSVVEGLKIEAETEEEAQNIAREMDEEDSVNWDDTPDPSYDFVVTMDPDGKSEEEEGVEG